MYVGSLAGVTYLRYTVLTRSNKSKTALYCCESGLSVSRNVFHVVSALQSIVTVLNTVFQIFSAVNKNRFIYVIILSRKVKNTFEMVKI